MCASSTAYELGFGRNRKVGFIDDSLEYLSILEIWQRRHFFPVYTTSDLSECLGWIARDEVDTLVADLRMPETDGISILEKARSVQPALETIILTAYTPTTAEKRRAEGSGIRIYQKESIGELQEYLAQPLRTYTLKEIRKIENRIEIMEVIHNEWVADLISVLKETPELRQAVISSAEGPFTVQQLIEDIEELRPRGVEYIRLWRRTLATVLNLKKEDTEHQPPRVDQPRWWRMVSPLLNLGRRGRG